MDTLAGFLPQPAPEDEDEEEDAHLLPQYWSAVSHRHQTRQEPNGNSPSISSILPETWVVVSAHATPDRKCLVLARHQAGHQPQLFRLPFNRFAAGDDEPFTLDAVMGSLKEIIAHSNRTSRVAKDLQKKEDRINWWKERKELDKNLGELLEGVESRWLGGFKVGRTASATLVQDEANVAKTVCVPRFGRRSIVRGIFSLQDHPPSTFHSFRDENEGPAGLESGVG
jgi:hypothetical protein